MLPLCQSYHTRKRTKSAAAPRHEKGTRDERPEPAALCGTQTLTVFVYVSRCQEQPPKPHPGPLSSPKLPIVNASLVALLVPGSKGS